MERPQSLIKQLASHTLWVCFLSPEGYESFASAIYENGTIVVPKRELVPQKPEISTIQFWYEDEQVTVLPVGYQEDGPLSFQTVETLVAGGALPEFTARSLARRIKMQPYRNNPGAAIYPLLQLPPFKGNL